MIEQIINSGNVYNDFQLFIDSLDIDKVQSVSNMFESAVNVKLTNENNFKIERN